MYNTANPTKPELIIALVTVQYFFNCMEIIVDYFHEREVWLEQQAQLAARNLTEPRAETDTIVRKVVLRLDDRA